MIVMRDKIKKALQSKYEGEIAEAQVIVEVFLENPVGGGVHPDIIEAMDTQMHRFAEAEDKLLVLEKYF